MEIIGYRKRNGRVEREFTPWDKETLKKDLSDERERFIEGNDCDGVDFAYRQRVSNRKLKEELAELGLTIEDVSRAKERYERKK